jgi:hypothetical protein
MKAELVDIATVITIASGSATIAHYTIKATKWVWTHRKDFADNLRRTPSDIVVNLQPISLHAEAQRLTVHKDLDLRWRVKAPTPSLARRLEDLVAWYLNVS